MFQEATPPPSSPVCEGRSNQMGHVPFTQTVQKPLGLPPRTPRKLQGIVNSSSPAYWANTPAPSSPADLGPSTSPTLIRAAPVTRSSNNKNKERKPPSVTPRRFTRFFHGQRKVLAVRCALNDITKASLNEVEQQSPSRLDGDRDISMDSGLAINKRPITHALGFDSAELGRDFKRQNRELGPGLLNVGLSQQSQNAPEATFSTPEPVQRSLLSQRSTAGQIFQRELGDIDRAFDILDLAHPVLDWRHQTADFCSSFDYVHDTTAVARPGQARGTIFSQAACNTSNMVFIGDDMGEVRLLDTETPGDDGFKKCHLRWTAHGNAVTDVALSSDDLRAATASADRSGIVWDMMTQKPLALLDCGSSAKSIRFQPGQGVSNVVATSTRDGIVQIWDLRCKNSRYSEWSQGTVDEEEYLRVANIPPWNTFVSGSTVPWATKSSSSSQSSRTVVTALEFLPAGKEHLVISSCEANATIKLWDIRAIRHQLEANNNASKPLSCVAPPPSHKASRNWGISSMTLGTDGARLYALCKDNTVYAYSTAHMALGHVPELEQRHNPLPRRNAAVHQGLAPLYGFRHALFTSPTFFVKCAIRPARDGRSELLAVGSGHGTPVLFPTDERYLHSQPTAASWSSSVKDRTDAKQDKAWTDEGSWGFPANTKHLAPRAGETTPIYTSGTPLIHGHGKEATSVSFTRDGRLVSASDDFTARVWAEDREQAKQLRCGGWTGGQRWGWGWASVEMDLDQDEVEDEF
ncbi:hypothetical protein MCOR10_007159 [Pyricularia oryzae]|nr:hypothetical protein MCOR10_007159 [Pyricularia oryzae]KAI6529244.1 hypothetical protein MCOR05_008123 [Pyricularia oryzae]